VERKHIVLMILLMNVTPIMVVPIVVAFVNVMFIHHHLLLLPNVECLVVA